MTTQIRDDLAQALWETLLLNSSNGRLPHGDIKRIADEFGFGRNVVGRIWRKGLTSMDSCVAAVVKAVWSRRGRKKVDRAGLCERVAQVPVVDRENQRTLQLATNTSAYLISQLIKEGYLWRALRRTCPLLTPKHISDRMKYCADRVLRTMKGGHYFDPMYDVVHLDEKWFYVKKVGGKVYVLTGKDDVPIDDPPVQYAQSKRHIKKVMFLCAVARPRGDWDGKVGIWPVVETYTTQRASVNRPAGVEEVRPVSMTREIYRDMLVNDVIPAIKAKWP
ncbi:hypothetical protein PF010_g24991 [Phytophthora fragariae]|uniref:DUF7769 domain-containing protein n=1 Tax=Phytophthora fragariae TaxID=53985 RepID=A0A6G0K111_9STRA|nr:hypothetical protein PF010_g24991 [Phytophthora fragariae]